MMRTTGLAGTKGSRHAGLLLLLIAIAGQTALAKGQSAAPEVRAAARSVAPAQARVAVEPAPAWVAPAEVPEVAAPPRAGLHVLLLDEQVRVEGAGAVRYSRAVRQVVERGGLEAASQIQVEFDPSYQKLVLHQVALWRNGRRVDKLDVRKVQLLQRETQLERQMVDGRVTASLVLDDVRVGDRIDYAYSLQGSNPVFDGRFVDVDWMLSSKGPAALVRYRLLAPQDRQIAVRRSAANTEIQSTVRGGWRETLVQRRQAPAFVFDPSMPESVLLDDEVIASEFADWHEVAAWAERIFSPAATSAPSVRAQAERLAAEAGSDPAARVLRTLAFVQDEVRYFGTEVGIATHRPADPARVLQQRFGDCKDKTALLVALLRHQGIDATPVLVSTSMGDAVPTMLPSPFAFDHAVAQVRVGDRRWLVDGTRAFQKGPLADVEAVDLGHGLPADGRADAPQALPSGAGLPLTEALDRITFKQFSEPPVLDAELTLYRQAAESMRSSLTAQPLTEIERSLVAEYARYYPGAVVSRPAQVEEVPGRNALRIRLQFTLSNYLRLHEDRVFAADYVLHTLMQPLRLPDQAPRTRPLRMAAPGVYRHEVVFNFPEASAVNTDRVRLDDPGELYSLGIEREATAESMRMRGELKVAKGMLLPEGWTAYRDRLFKLWPRLSGTATIPTLTPAQGQDLRERYARLMEALKRGQSPLRTIQQVDAQVRLWVLDARLEGQRLPSHLRGAALLDRGVQLDHLDRVKEAEASFRDALALTPDSGEAHAALATNALLRGDDALAVQQAEEALRLAPSAPAARYTLAYAKYYGGRHEEAREQLQFLLQQQQEAERGYAALWLNLATRRLGGDGPAASRPYVQADGAWPQPVVRLLSGSGTFGEALKAARSDPKLMPGRLCELYFFAGQQQLLDGDAARARESFRKAVDTGVVEFIEHRLAARELARLPS